MQTVSAATPGERAKPFPPRRAKAASERYNDQRRGSHEPDDQTNAKSVGAHEVRHRLEHSSYATDRRREPALGSAAHECHELGEETSASRPWIAHRGG